MVNAAWNWLRRLPFHDFLRGVEGSIDPTPPCAAVRQYRQLKIERLPKGVQDQMEPEAFVHQLGTEADRCGPAPSPAGSSLVPCQSCFECASMSDPGWSRCSSWPSVAKESAWPTKVGRTGVRPRCFCSERPIEPVPVRHPGHMCCCSLLVTCGPRRPSRSSGRPTTSSSPLGSS